MTGLLPIKAAPVNAPVAPRFWLGHHRRRVTEQRRSAATAQTIFWHDVCLPNNRAYARFFGPVCRRSGHRAQRTVSGPATTVRSSQSWPGIIETWTL